MAAFQQVYSLDNDVFNAYAFYAAVMALKMFAVVFGTSYFRFSKHPRIFTNSEDASYFNGKLVTDPDVERIRRCHLNDLENIVPFWALGLLFVATNPSVHTATMCYRIFAASRIAHTFIYVFSVPQPARAISFFIGMLINLFMGYEIIAHSF